LRSDGPLILAFDTSEAHCAAALLSGDVALAHRNEAMARGQAERLVPMLEEVLRDAGAVWADVDVLCVCTGPGNFTGVRLGVATARGLAMALDRPAIGVSRFEALAEGLPGRVLISLADRRNLCFLQILRDGVPQQPPFTLDVAEHLPRDSDLLCIGHDAGRLARTLGLRAGSEVTRADLRRLARVATRRRDHAPPRPEPLYVRQADAAPQGEPIPVLIDVA